MRNRKINKSLDKAIVNFCNGNSHALSEIYDYVARIVFSISYAIVKNYQDAEDILQETMIEITKYANTYKEGSNAMAWILTMTRHLAINVLRKRKNTTNYEEIENNNSSNIAIESNHSSLEVFEMLSVLSEDEKQIVILRLNYKMPYKEIAAIMNITVSSAEKRFQRSIKKLKESFSSEV